MKQKKNNYIFSNFNQPLSSKISNNELTPNFYYNISLNNNCIESANGFSDFFKSYFSEEEYLLFTKHHADILKSIIDFQIYEYFDIFTSTYKHRLFFIDNNFHLLEYVNQSVLMFNNVSFYEKPNIISNQGKLYFYSNSFMCYIDGNGTPIISTASAIITSFVTINNTMYFLHKHDRFNIYVSNDSALEMIYSDVTSFAKIVADASYGEILKIVNIKNRVYVFQKYKISYLSVSGNDYNLTDICDLNCMIHGDTISSNESYIYFCTTNGLYMFDGNDVKNLHSYLFNKIVNQNTDISIVYNGAYYLKTTLIFNNERINAVLKINQDNQPVIYKINDVLNLQTIKNNSGYFLALILKSGQVLQLNSSNSDINDNYIKFNKITFNSSALKHITGLKVFNNGKCKLTISSDLTKSSCNIEDNFKISNIDISGHIFEFAIESNDSFGIESIFVEVSTIEDSND